MDDTVWCPTQTFQQCGEIGIYVSDNKVGIGAGPGVIDSSGEPLHFTLINNYNNNITV